MGKKGLFSKEENAAGVSAENSNSTETNSVSKENQAVKNPGGTCTCSREMGVTKVKDEYFCNKCKGSVGKEWPNKISGTGPYVKVK